MKKIIALALALVMLFALAACGNSDAEPNTPSAPAENEGETKEWGEAENTWLTCISSTPLNGEHPYYQAQVFFD